MNAKITYKVAECPHPWDKKRRAEGEKAWCLIKVTTPEFGQVLEDAVALFNWNHEATTFQGHVLAAGLNGKLVDIDKDVAECFRRGIRI